MSDITSHEYWTEVRELAESIAAEAKAEEQDVYERLHETIDGHQWIIYTAYNFDVLRHCSNHDAYTEEYGADGVVTDGQVNWALLAFAALYRDVLDRLPETANA